MAYKQKMYSIVLRHLSGIQKGIQHGHSKDAYEKQFSRDKEYKHWLEKDKTVIVLQCNSCKEIWDVENKLRENNVKCSVFLEEDLHNIATSISFLVDERVWDLEKYPNVIPTENINGIDSQIEANKIAYGEQVGFLRSLLKQFQLAQN
jgi:hypothetical protein